MRTLLQAVGQSPVTIDITGPSGNIEYVNPKLTELTGFTREEALGPTPRVLKSGTMPPQVYEELWRALSAGQVWSGELQNGNEIPPPSCPQSGKTLVPIIPPRIHEERK